MALADGVGIPTSVFPRRKPTPGKSCSICLLQTGLCNPESVSLWLERPEIIELEQRVPDISAADVEYFSGWFFIAAANH